jgi:hypothetical protein
MKRLQYLIALFFLSAASQGLLAASQGFGCEIFDCVACSAVTRPNQETLTDEVRRQLPNLNGTVHVLSTTLSSAGEQVILYNSSPDELEPQPRVAVADEGKVVTIFDAESNGGFTRLLAACELPLEDGRNAMVMAYRAGGDGSVTMFLFVGFNNGKYIVLNTLHAPASRIVIDGQGRFSMWWGQGSNKCVWCPQRYNITKYRFDGAHFVPLRTTKGKQLLQPGDIADTPLTRSETAKN